MIIKIAKKLLLFTFTFLLLLFHPGVTCKASEATTYDISKKDVVISKSGNYIITGKTTTHTITVKKGVNATISLKNLSINNTTESPESFDIKSGASVNLILYGTNNIISSFCQGSAIHVPYGAKLVISKKSTGKLTAKAGNGAGIGGSVNSAEEETGTITINGGTIYAQGGYNNCGIGGGETGRYGTYKHHYIGGGDITINGGTVTAIGGDDTETGGSAGIGGASLTRQGKITITGGSVLAYSKEAGIGGEHSLGKGNKITISGGIVTAKGEQYASAIGNSLNPAGTTVTITGGMITAKGDYGRRTLYPPYLGDSNESRNSLKAYDISAEKIIINGGNVLAYTFNKSPVNSEGNVVYQTFINCKEGAISKITMGEDIYGSKDMASNGYLSLYLRPFNGKLIIKNKNGDIFDNYVWMVSSPVENIEKTTSVELDISKGNIEIINGGYIYQNKVYRCDFITITGSTTSNQVFVHNHKGSQNIVLKNLKVNYKETDTQDFMIVDNDVVLNLHLKGSNSMELRDNARGIYIGHDVALNFTGAETDSFHIITGKNAHAIYTNYGNITQNGSYLNFDLGENSSAVNVGNYGTFTLNSGKFEAHGDKYSSITGLSSLIVTINGGTLLADIIGIMENGNEELTNNSYFTITGGNVEVNRLVFAHYSIYNGTISAYILGSGTGCHVVMYDGNVEIGAYINYQNERLVTDIRKETILGGIINQRNDVPKEILDKIKTDLG